MKRTFRLLSSSFVMAFLTSSLSCEGSKLSGGKLEDTVIAEDADITEDTDITEDVDVTEDADVTEDVDATEDVDGNDAVNGEDAGLQEDGALEEDADEDGLDHEDGSDEDGLDHEDGSDEDGLDYEDGSDGGGGSSNESCGPWKIACPSDYECVNEQCQSKPRILGWINGDSYIECSEHCIDSDEPEAFGTPVLADPSIYIPPGEFYMGCSPLDGSCASYSQENPQHLVTFSAGYGMDETLVTAEAYSYCVDYGTCETAPGSSGSNATYGQSGKEDHPVNYVNWQMAVDYCTWQGKRLPTEAEWERASRGGCETLPGVDCAANMRVYPWGNAAPDSTLLNFNGNVGSTTPVKNYPDGLSPYGLYDMSGNVWEWVADWYDGNYYNSSPSTDPSGPSTGSYRVYRGGSFYYPAAFVRSGSRDGNTPGYAGDGIGFRCLRSN